MSLALLPTPSALAVRMVALVAAVALNGVATGMYIGAGLGAGPRDGLMTGVAACTGWSIRRSRTGIEISALIFGCLLGGTVGLGTVLYALAIGPAIQLVLPAFTRWASEDVAQSAPGVRA